MTKRSARGRVRLAGPIALVCGAMTLVACGQAPTAPTTVEDVERRDRASTIGGLGQTYSDAGVATTAAANDCTATITPRRKTIGVGGARFSVQIRFKKAVNPAACGPWTLAHEGDLRLIVSDSGSKLLSTSGTGNADVRFEVPNSIKFSGTARKKRVTTWFALSGAANAPRLELKADRWCPELRWCR